MRGRNVQRVILLVCKRPHLEGSENNVIDDLAHAFLSDISDTFEDAVLAKKTVISSVM